MAEETDPQAAVVAFLSDPASYGPGVERIDIIETHISLVFLAGDRAYKLKRAVKLPYLDFSTEARRRPACEAELRLNRRTAPDLYLEVRAVSVKPDERLGWGEAGHIVDWVVVMRRFDQGRIFDSIAKRGMLSPELLRELVDHIFEFHAQAERLFGFGGSAATAKIEQTNVACLKQHAESIFPPGEIDELHARSLTRLTSIATLLDARSAAGNVRRCHGDLHLRNICLHDGRPVLFDCIEFSDEIAGIDTLYDFAFLLMDLEHRRLRDLANQGFNRYLDLTGDDEGLAALPLFLSLRAAVRAHVLAMAATCGGATTTLENSATDARRYLDLARALLQPQAPRLIAIGGLSGSGKSTVARALAPTMGAHLGARVLRSDVLRKRLLDVMPEVGLPAEAYSPEVSRRVYEIIRDKAAVALRAGYCVIIDAVSLREDERASFAAVAADADVPFCGIWLDAPAAVMAARLEARRGDASDADPEVLHQQLGQDLGRLDWVRVNIRGDGNSLAAVRRALK